MFVMLTPNPSSYRIADVLHGVGSSELRKLIELSSHTPLPSHVSGPAQQWISGFALVA